MHLINTIASILLIVGGLNWGLVGLLDMNLVETLVGGIADGMLVNIVYDLVGLSAVLHIMQGKLLPKA
jgi:uncharacterized protein